MGSLKPVLGLVRTVVPILYCGGLLYYFIGYAGSLQDAEAIGMGPTLLGLAVVGGLFCIVLVIKLVLIFATLRPSGSAKRSVPGTPPDDGDGSLDADAMIARYRARQPEGAVSPSLPRPHSPGAPVTGFGRRIR